MAAASSGGTPSAEYAVGMAPECCACNAAAMAAAWADTGNTEFCWYSIFDKKIFSSLSNSSYNKFQFKESSKRIH
jgi:hypothetical protein